MATWTRLACTGALALLGAVHSAHAGLYLTGADGFALGNTAYGRGQPSFQFSKSFEVKWADTSVPASERFVDLVGGVSAASSAFLFTGVSLVSADGLTTFGSFGSASGSSRIDFTFGRLVDGLYTLQFFGGYVPAPAVTPRIEEWGFSYRAVASPAPEASDLAMLSLGLVGVVAWAKRAKLRQAA